MKAVPPRAMSPGAYKERQKKQQEARDKAKLLLTPDKQSSSLQSAFKSAAAITTTSISMVDSFNHVAKVKTHQAEHQVSHTYPHINSSCQSQIKSVSPSLFLRLYRAIKEFLALCIIQSNTNTNINPNIVSTCTNHKETGHPVTGNNEKTPDTVLSIDETRSETLPDDLQDKVNNITLLHSMLEKHYLRLDETDQHNLKSLVIDRLPRYIADFLLVTTPRRERRGFLNNIKLCYSN